MPHDPAAGPGWARLLVVLLSRAYRAMLLTLVAIAAAPLVAGWGSYVVASGSMQPSIAVGDVVLARPTSDDHKVRVGRVYVFEDPTSPERLLVHRVVERRDDGDYTTAGDANDVTDLTPLKASAIRAQALLLVPYVGLPVHWFRTQDWVPLAIWLVASGAAFVLAHQRLDTKRPSRRGPQAKVAVATAVAVGAVAAGTTGAAGATFTDRTNSSGNHWTVGRWLLPYVQAVMADDPTGFWLMDETSGVWAQDRSGNNLTGRYGPAVTLGHPGSLPNNPGTSARPGTGRITLNPSPIGAPQTSSNEIWFRTTSTSGGTLFGFQPSTPWGITDRLLQMQPDGRLVYGDWEANPYRTTVTPTAYNDGRWHHVVVSSIRQGNRQAVTIFVDGQPVAAGEGSAVGTSTGSWFVGPFDGFVDNAAIYDTNLAPAQVQAHHAAR